MATARVAALRAIGVRGKQQRCSFLRNVAVRAGVSVCNSFLLAAQQNVKRLFRFYLFNQLI